MRHLLALDDLTHTEILDLCLQTRTMKHWRTMYPAMQPEHLSGKTLALLFEKPSLRTRVSFEIAMLEQGGHSLYLSPQEVGLGKRESIADVARVLSSYVHAIVIRTFDHATIEEFAHHSTVPVINGLTDKHHPCQGLTDIYTILDHFGFQNHLTMAYIGDGNNVAHSLIQAAAKMGLHIRIATPPGYEPDDDLLNITEIEAVSHGGSLLLTHDPAKAAYQADVLYTDVWVSMGQEHEAQQKIHDFAGFCIDDTLVALAHKHAIVMHPLPAHRGIEITDSVIDGAHSVVFAQAENRLHLQKAVLHWLLPTKQEIQAVKAHDFALTHD